MLKSFFKKNNLIQTRRLLIIDSHFTSDSATKYLDILAVDFIRKHEIKFPILTTRVNTHITLMDAVPKLKWLECWKWWYTRDLGGIFSIYIQDKAINNIIKSDANAWRFIKTRVHNNCTNKDDAFVNLSSVSINRELHIPYLEYEKIKQQARKNKSLIHIQNKYNKINNCIFAQYSYFDVPIGSLRYTFKTSK